MDLLAPAPPEAPPLDRFSFYAKNGFVSMMEPDTEELMQERAWHEIVDDEYDSPHSRAWHVSMHASEFPGDPASACVRYFTYRMMNVPSVTPMPPWVTACGVVGKAGEIDIADAWYRGGRMLAVPEGVTEPETLAFLKAHGKSPDDIKQLGFEDGAVWMTASTDLPILKKGWRKPVIVEVKGKASEVLEEMLTGVRKDGTRAPKLRGPDPQHVNQLKASLGLAQAFDWGEVGVCSHCWRIVASELMSKLMGVPYEYLPWSDAFGVCRWCRDYETTFFQLEPPDCGEVYYWDRSWPRRTKSFYFEHDRAFLDAGRAVFGAARDAFVAGELPPRPDHFQWSIGPCGQCRFKPSCRLDFGLETPKKRKPSMPPVTELAESYAVAHARSMRPDYDYEATRGRVLEEWS